MTVKGLLQQMEKPPPALGVTTQTQEEYKGSTVLDFCNLEIEIEPNITAGSAIVHQRYLTAVITIFQTQTPLVRKPTHASIHVTLHR